MTIPINAGIVDEAIFHILRREQVEVGGWIRLSTLARQWWATGLRRSDLVEGLARLENGGYLSLEGSEDETVAILRKRPPLFRPDAWYKLRTLYQIRARPRSGTLPANDRRKARA